MILLDHANSLPFPRGQTLCDQAGVATVAAIGGSAASAPSTYMDQLVGRVFVTADANGRPLALRVVRADAALTPGSSVSVAGACVDFTAAKVGRNVAGLTGTAGKVAAIIDDAYPSNKVTIAQYDLFYVVAEGDVKARAATCAAADVAVVAAGSGYAVTAATAASYGQFVIGVSNQATGGTTANHASIHVWPDLKKPVPAS